jgi:quinol monooxygenase YgiN
MFIQTISFTTSRADELQQLADQYDRDNPDAPGFLRSRILRDRDRENAYVIVAEFENYELAMENSNRPETDAFAKKMGELLDGPPQYGNYDVIAEQGRG